MQFAWWPRALASLLALDAEALADILVHAIPVLLILALLVGAFARASAANLASTSRRHLEPEEVNERINGFISSGRYREAVGLYVEHRSQLGQPWLGVLVRINVAEALYNLGRWNRARQLTDAARRAATEADFLGWVETGRRAQRAWIAAHDGDVALGRDLMADLDESDFPADYVAELHFTRAAVEFAAGDAAAAGQHLETARRCLCRASSERNLLFLEARLAVLKGEKDRAIDLCRQASEHPYRGQGGDGLLLWGDLLAERGDLDGARAAWRLAIERDPESESARLATQRPG